MKMAPMFLSIALVAGGIWAGGPPIAAADTLKVCEITPPKPVACKVSCYFGCGVTYEEKNLKLTPPKSPCSRYCKNGPNGELVEVSTEDGTSVAKDAAIKAGLVSQAPKPQPPPPPKPSQPCTHGHGPFSEDCVIVVPK